MPSAPRQSQHLQPEFLFPVFADRYERPSLLVTGNLAFSEWVQVFQGDRLRHRWHLFEMNGESFCFRASMKAKKSKTGWLNHRSPTAE